MTDPDLAECWNELRPAPEAPALLAKAVPQHVAIFPVRTPTNAREADLLLITLWTKATKLPGYDKSEWMALQAAIWALMPSGPDR